jgi:pseudaminic acid synthase
MNDSMNPAFNIKDKCIGDGNPCYVIAEMSANHGGGFESAIEIIHAAKESGADCIKIQTYTADTLTINSDKEIFQIKNGTWEGENLYNLYERAYTPWEWQESLKNEAEKIGLDFLSTPFDASAVDFLNKLGVDFYKIASFELIDIPLIKYIASQGKPIIMSTGMGTLGEIEEAVNTVKAMGNENLCLLRCSSAYPAVPEDMNLKTIPHMKESFGCPVGLSDHSLGSISAIAAIATGANVIEKHFCLSRDIPTPDSSFSMEPAEFKQMVDDIRTTERAMGKIDYSISDRENESKIFRKSIFVVSDIKQGENFTAENIRVIRPANGIHPRHYFEILGHRATKDVERGTPLQWNMVD